MTSPAKVLPAISICFGFGRNRPNCRVSLFQPPMSFPVIALLRLSLRATSSCHRSFCLRRHWFVQCSWSTGSDNSLGPRYWPRKSHKLACISDPTKTNVRTDRSTKWAIQIKRRGENCGIARASRRRSQNVDLASLTSIRSSKFRTAPLNRLTDEAGESRLKFLSPPDNLRFCAVSCARFPAWVAPASL